MSTAVEAPGKILLEAEALSRTLARIAHEIVEGNPDLETVALVGIHTRGVPLAQRLRRLIEERSGVAPDLGAVDITFYRDDVAVRGGRAPLHPQPVVRSTSLEFPLEGRTVVLVDDVLYTGRTIRAAIEALFDYGRPDRIQLAVLVDRGHRELPIRPDYVGKNLATARTFERSLEREVKKLPTLKGRLVINVFYESSTRTSSSFELAAKRLSADTMSIKSSGSSVDKGESLKDTALTLGAYEPDVIVIRHPHIGAPRLVARYTEAHVVNAGDGKHQHPTQALLDLYTIREQVGPLDGLHVAIVGDVLHSRVARSNIQALTLMGSRVTLVGPPPLLPRGIEAMGCELSHDIRSIAAADVVYVLRMQRERMQEGANYVPSLREYTARWGVTPERLRPGQKVMHPGPMNRGVEIDPRVADHQDALIEIQVRAGLVVRMAVLYDLLTHGPVAVAPAAATPLE